MDNRSVVMKQVCHHGAGLLEGGPVTNCVSGGSCERGWGASEGQPDPGGQEGEGQVCGGEGARTVQYEFREPEMEQHGIYSYRAKGRVHMEIGCEEGLLVIAMVAEKEEDMEEGKASFAAFVRKELDDEDIDPEAMLTMEQRFPVQKYREAFFAKTLAVYRRFLIPAARPASPLPPGLFKATYGPHGVELVMVEVPADQSIAGMRAVKITGDPNVPFDKVTFEIEDSRCLNLPLEAQESCHNILRAMEAPQYVDFQVTAQPRI